MSRRIHFPRRRAGLLLVLALALVRRLFLAGELRATPLAFWHLWEETDMNSFWRQAGTLAAGDWLARRPYVPLHEWMRVAPPEVWRLWHPAGQFYQPPLYSYFLALLMKLTADPVQAARAVQLVLGVATCGLIYGLARRLGGGRAGVVAGLLAALYGPLLAVETQLLRDGPLLFGLTLALWLYARAARRLPRAVAARRARVLVLWALALGALLGALAMLHEAAFILGAILAALGARRIVWSGRCAGCKVGRLLGVWLAAFALGGALGFAPLAARNLALGLSPAPRYAGSLFAFAVANQAEAFRGGAVWNAPGPAFAAALTRAQGRPLALIGEVLRSYGGAVAWRWPLHGLMRLAALAAGGENNENLCYAYFRLRLPLLSLAVSHRILLPLAAAGLVFWGRRRAWRALLRGRLGAALMLHGAALALLLAAVLPLGRYRLALLPLWVPLAGVGVMGLWRAAHADFRRPAQRRRLSLALGLILMTAVGQWEIDRAWAIGTLRPVDFLVASRFYDEWGRADLAELELCDAIARGVDAPEVVRALTLQRARMAETRGDETAAARFYDQLLALAPRHPSALTRLAWIRATSPSPPLRSGRVALELARQRSQVAPAEPARTLDLEAAALAELGRFDQAAARASQALAAARAGGQTALATEIAARLALYQQRQPYRHPLR